MKKNTQKYLSLFLLLILFAAQFFFISPRGEFALNDDWVHTDTIKHWTETGEFRLMPYAGPTFYVPILYGTALVKIFGFSFTLLRISTLVLTLCLLITVYYLLVRLSNKPALSFFATLILWLNPIFYNLSFTFMADIPALLFLIASIYFYYAGFEKGNNKHLFWGTIFGLLSAFTRQTGILIVISAIFYNFINFKNFQTRPKNFLLNYGLPLAIAGTIYTFLNIYGLLPQSTLSHTIEGIWRLIGHMKWWSFYIPMYLAFFTLPLTIPWFIAHRPMWRSKTLWIIFFILTDIVIAVRQIWHLQFPYIENIISPYGLGPMKGAISGSLTSILPSWGWGVVSIVAAFSLSLLIMIFAHRRHNDEPIHFTYLFAFLYLIPILLFQSFDRYLLPVFLVLIIALIQKIKHVKFSYLTSFLILIIFGLYSLTQTQFYLEWNKTRWEMANELKNKGIPSTTIDGGYEWNGWNNYWATIENEKLTFTDEEIQMRTWWQRRFFPQKNEAYIISFSPQPYLEIVAEKDMNAYNPNDKLFLLKTSKKDGGI